MIVCVSVVWDLQPIGNFRCPVTCFLPNSSLFLCFIEQAGSFSSSLPRYHYRHAPSLLSSLRKGDNL